MYGGTTTSHRPLWVLLLFAVVLDMVEGGTPQASQREEGSFNTNGTPTLSDSYSSGKAAKPDLALRRVLLRISPAMLAIFLSVGTSMLVFPFFTFMRSTGLLGVRLAQVCGCVWGARGCLFCLLM